MTADELIKIGFSHRYKPSIKKVDYSSLGYSFLFEAGNVIQVELSFLESRNEWFLDYVKFQGELAYELLKKDLENFTLEKVIDFVKKHPSQTF